MFLSVVTVAFRNYEGVVKTWRSLRNLARDPGLSFEWIVVDGGSEDGTREFLQKRHGEFNLRFISEKDRGIYDAMNKALRWRRGAIPCFLIPGMRSMMMPRCLSANWRGKRARRYILATRCWISAAGIKYAGRLNPGIISTIVCQPAIRRYFPDGSVKKVSL